MQFPPRLKKGDTILLVSPSSPLSAEQPVEAIAAEVEKLGFRVKIANSCRASTPSGYAAAPAEMRAADLNGGFTDPEIDAIWCTRGGSTAWQILPLLDYPAIAAHPKPFIGFSDITTLHLALQQRCGFVTFHGPTANRALKNWADDPFSWQSLWAALEMRGCLEVVNPPGEEIKTLRPGRACGRLTGGNLSLATTSVGTPWQIDARGCILYLEDVGEDVYALEEMLWQLKSAGVLDSAAGLVFGAFQNCRNAYREDYGPEALLKDFFAGWSKPILYNVRSAHCSPMVTLPMGTMCEINGSAGTMIVRCPCH